MLNKEYILPFLPLNKYEKQILALHAIFFIFAYQLHFIVFFYILMVLIAGGFVIEIIRMIYMRIKYSILLKKKLEMNT
jgi:hypothetical protein